MIRRLKDRLPWLPGRRTPLSLVARPEDAPKRVPVRAPFVRCNDETEHRWEAAFFGGELAGWGCTRCGEQRESFE